MPCYDPRDNNNGSELYSRIDTLQARCDYLTDLLCKAGRAAYAKKQPPLDVEQWWAEHCSWDAARGEPWSK